MPGSQAMQLPAAGHGAALVSVDGRTYPLESARIRAEASGGIACSTLVQTYRNPYAEPLEVLYTMPLPADGAVIGYQMRLGERVIRGEVRPREEARQAYEKALFEGRAAGLFEQERDDTFTQRLGSLPAGATAEITIEVLHPLGFLVGAGDDGSRWEYRFPTVVGVRYEGGAGRVPDADTLDADRAGGGEIPTRIELTLTTIDPAGRSERRVESMPLDRDLVVRWPAASREIGASLIEGPGLPGDDGRYGLLTITPPQVPAVEFSRDLTVLIDASGSMSGRPIEWAKEVAAGLLRSLGSGDRFEVIAFASKPRPLTSGLVPVSDGSVTDALDQIYGIRAGGGTEMTAAVVEALRPLRTGSQHQVVLISDGEIGFEDEIVARIVERLPDGARLHTVGVGAAPNRTLTLRAARAGRGVESFVCGDEEVADTVRRLVAATARPVLTDLKIGGRAVTGIAPARPRDVLAGQPLVLAIELAPGGGSVEVSGRLASAGESWAWNLTVPPLAERAAAVASLPFGALYGRETIADLEMKGGRSDERVTEVALRHRIASRMTSLVAISEEPSVDPNAPRRRRVLPVELPAYLSADSLGFRSRESFSPSRGLGESLGSAKAREGSPRLAPASWLRAMRARPPYRTVRGRVLAVEGEILVIEYESPEDGFLAPETTAAAEIFGRPIGLCTVDPARSSPRGPHARGLLLRLGLRRAKGWAVRGELAFVGDNDVRIELTLGEVS